MQENLWHRFPLKGTNQILRISSTPDEVAAGSTITIHAKATLVRAQVFAGPYVNVNEVYKEMVDIDATNLRHSIAKSLKITAKKTIYVGVIYTPVDDGSIQVKYTRTGTC